MAKKNIEDEALGAETEPTSPSTMLVPVIAEKPSFIDLIVFKEKEKNLKIIKDKRAEYALVVIDGVGDKDNYNKVVANMGQMKNDRIAFENAAYDNVIDPLKKALASYKTDVDAIIDEFKAGEKAERDKKDFIDTEKKRLKKEAEEAKQRAAILRINELNTLGAVFNGSSYSFPYDGGLLINTLQLTDFSDKEFNEFLSEVKDSYQVEQNRIAEEERIKKEADDEAAQKSIKVEQQEAANKVVEDELLKKRTRLRLKEITLLGAEEHEPEEYSFPAIIGCEQIVTLNAIKEMEDATWEELIYDLEHFTPAVEPLVNIEVESELVATEMEDNSSTSHRQPVSKPHYGYVANESDGDIPVSKGFYLADVNDYSEKVTSFEQLKEWAAEALIDDVRQDTPHGEMGATENTMLFKYDGKFYEITITNIDWNRYDKQFYYIEMFGEPKLEILQVVPMPGIRPIYSAQSTISFKLDKQWEDIEISPKYNLRVFPDEYSEEALNGCTLARQGKIQSLNYAIVAKV